MTEEISYLLTDGGWSLRDVLVAETGASVTMDMVEVWAGTPGDEPRGGGGVTVGPCV